MTLILSPTKFEAKDIGGDTFLVEAESDSEIF